ncbi:MAG: GntR family transcriptional regulator [Leucobacter sp.]|nr:GntR family transcriptional regulator [Leucobacter sp.]
MAGEYAPGQSIKAEAIGEQLSVSATPVREALQALRAEGFLDLIPRRGFTVAHMVGEDIRDIFAAHALIAGDLAARATARATAADLAELEALHLELMAAAHRGDNEALELKNHQFHRLIYRIAGSNRLRWALGVFTKYVPRRFYSQIEGWPSTTAQDHSAVLEAIARGDAEAARAAMARHIENSGELLAQNFDRRSAG